MITFKIHGGARAVVRSGAIPWQLRDCERIIAGNAALLAQKHFLIGITRVRNEALILGDSLDFVGQHVDAIIAYDDASTDKTLELLRSHPKVVLILANKIWEPDVQARRMAEHRHRQLLLQCAREKLRFDWTFCFDADERVTGDLRGFASGPRTECYDGVSIQLFDAYLTPHDCVPYRPGQELLGFAEGHEREPGGISRLRTDLYCQHYGKSLSVEHWEETCDYYIKHFPFETYGRKWLARKGRAIHTESDFMRPLYEWGDELFENAVKI